MRPQIRIKEDVEKVLAEFPDIRNLSHFTCHFLGAKLSVQLEVEMDENLTISQAKGISKRVREKLIDSIDDLNDADIHLELSSH